MLAFLDLETTGLNEREGSIIELALVVTDDRLKEQGRFSVIVNPMFGFDHMDPYVVQMHTKNGLLKDIENGLGVRRYEAESAALKFVQQYPEGMPLAGNTVHFDKTWIKYHMPQLHAYFHYRIVDVTSFNEMAARLDPVLHSMRPRAGVEPDHRALNDVLESIATLKFYMDNHLFGRR